MKLSTAIAEFRDWRGFKVTGHTVVRYDGVLKIFCLAMGDREVEDIKIEQVLKYLKNMEDLGWKRNGITIVCLALRKLFEYLNLKGLKVLNESLIPLPRKEFRIPRVANEQDFEKLLSVIPNDNNPNNIRNRALLNLVWDSMARAGEIVALNEDNLVFGKDLSGETTIKTEKSRGRRPIRQIFWSKQTGRHLKKWLETKNRLIKEGAFEDNEAVFLSIRKCGGFDSRGKRMTGRGVCEVFRMLSNRARLPTIFNAHSARHFGGRTIIEQGGTDSDVSNLLGHSNIESSFVYTWLFGDSLRQRYNHFRKR